MVNESEIQIQNMNHLGIIAGIIDDLGIEEIINQEIGVEDGEIVTSGQIVKAIILNGLGFVSRPLYLFPQFFEDKPVEDLIGEGIEAKHLNDYKIGRVMDLLYAKGLSPLFLLIGLNTVDKYGIKIDYSHLDSSSVSLHGEYKTTNNLQIENIMSENPLPITITQGYSRDHRPDLKQFMLDLIVSGDGDIPLFLRVGSGNVDARSAASRRVSDKAVFGKIAKEYREMVTFETMIVCDSAFYTEKNIQLMGEMEWLSRVPFTINEAKRLVEETPAEKFTTSETLEGYSYLEVESNYGGIKQRWIIVESQKREISDNEKLNKKINREKEKIEKNISEIVKKEFSSEEKALEKVTEIQKSLKYHELSNIKVSEITSKKNKSSKKEVQENVDALASSLGVSQISYQITANIEFNQQLVEELKRKNGRFILATNRLAENKTENKFSADDIIAKYKEQQSPERGFRFLKDPLFFADSVFLKSPERIETMAMLMGLCLMVYSLGQRELRKRLEEAKTGLKNQLGKLTKRPTLRWIFQCFQGIHLLVISGVKQIINLTEERKYILSFFPPSCQKYYHMFSG